jgi:hypothetical protein
MAESLLYKTPSPVCAKRRLSGIPVRTTTITEGGAPGPSERVPNDAVRRIVSSGGDRPGSGDVPWRRGSFSGSSDVLKKLEEETESVDSSMGFRELERVRNRFNVVLTAAHCQNQATEFRFEVGIASSKVCPGRGLGADGRERMTANAEKIHHAEKLALEVYCPHLTQLIAERAIARDIA